MLKKTISSLMTLLAALLLASCASSHSTQTIKQQLLAQELPRKTKFRLRLA